MRAVMYLRVSTKEQAERDQTEEGFSIPAQREACSRYAADHGWEIVDEYVDRGESARSAHRPRLQALLTRITEDGDIDAVIVHKVDRLARNMEDHIAIRAAFKRHGVALHSVSENLEETASGKLVEGIHALMAEFFSSNLATEVKKGMGQKAKMGGWPHQAPIGYRNVKEYVGGKQVTQIIPDPERAPLIRKCFELYATGDWTLNQLLSEMTHRGLRSKTGKCLPISTLARTLGNKFYAGAVEWQGVEYPGQHEPLVSKDIFTRVQEILGSRSMRGTRERKHNHYLKGSVWCGVCGRRLSVQPAKDIYLYFYCLGQKNRNRTSCRERYVSADLVENHVESLYDRLQLPHDWVEQLRERMTAKIDDHQRDGIAERGSLDIRKARSEDEKRKLMDAYYAGAIDIGVLKTEQGRIAAELEGIESRLDILDARAAEWHGVLEQAVTFATHCGRTYRKASDRERRALNSAVIERLEVSGGKITEVKFHAPFDLLFSSEKFEYARMAVPTGFEPVSPP